MGTPSRDLGGRRGVPHRRPPPLWSLGTLSLTSLDVGVAAVRTSTTPRFFEHPGASLAAGEAVVVVAAAGLLLTWLGHDRRAVRGTSAVFGALGGVVLVSHLCLEHLGRRVGEDGRVTLAFMATVFLVWGVAGFRARRLGGSASATGCAAGIFTTLIAVAAGHALGLAGLPTASDVATWSEFARSGWGDAGAFAVRNALDATVSRLATGVIVGAMCGALGGVTRQATTPASA